LHASYFIKVTSQANAPFFVDQEEIVLTRHGIWLSDGLEITHEPTRKLFARSLKRDALGYFLQIGRETKRIQVEDTPYFIHRIDGSPDQGYLLWINDETHEPLNPVTLQYQPGRLVCELKQNEKAGCQAKFLSAAYFDLLKNLEEDANTYFLRFGSIRINLAQKR
jgi:hypothetical protein